MWFKRQFWRNLWFLNLGLIFIFWLKNNYQLFLDFTTSSLALSLAKILGFLTMYLVLTQFFLMSRNLWLEGVYGLDGLARFHRQNGRRILYLLIFHPVLMILANNSFAKLSFWNEIVLFMSGLETQKAFLGLVFFFFVASISAWTVLQNARYEFWYLAHLFSYLAVWLSFSHQFELGSSLNQDPWFYGYWAGLHIFVGLNILWFRFLGPIFVFLKHEFYVSRIVPENYNTNSIYISGKNLDNFKTKAGQFMIFRFLDKKRFWEAHPFSLSKLSDGKEIRITPKAIGNFTSELVNLKPGTKVIIEGPFGVFMDSSSIAEKVLLIAGGIGITPLRCLAEEMTQKGKDAVLFYSNKAKRDVVFEKELSEIKGLRVFYIFSDAEGHLDEERIKRLVPDFFEREIFLCGPGPMMSSIRKILRKIGFPLTRLHYEKFSL